MSPITLNDLPAPLPGRTGWPWTQQSEPMPATQPDGSPWPKISIVTPSYNQGQFIEETIRSVLLQGYPNLEYVVMDGGSDDETVRILEKYDPWIDHWVSEPDGGQSDAINKGFDRASGELYAWLNSDDRYLSNALQLVVREYMYKPSSDVLIGEAQKVRLDGSVVYTAHVPELSMHSFLHWRNPDAPVGLGNFLQPACFFSRVAWEKSGPLRLDLTYCMDVDLWMKMIQDFEFRSIDSKIAIALAHENAKTTGETERTTAEVNLLVAEYGGWEIARRNLFRQADALVEARGRLRMITNHPVYRLIRPFYKWFTRR